MMRAGVVANRRQRDRHVEDRAVAVDPLGLERLDPLALADPLQDVGLLVAAVRRDDAGDGPADRLGGGVAEHLLGAGVPRQDVAGRLLVRIASSDDSTTAASSA